MSTNRQLALDCAVRIVNTKILHDQINPDDKIGGQILTMADKFAEWLGPDAQKSFGGPRQEKPTFDQPCPICKSEMWDLRPSKKNPKAPDARCKNAGKWNAAENKFDGCQGVIWLEAAQ